MLYNKENSLFLVTVESKVVKDNKSDGNPKTIEAIAMNGLNVLGSFMKAKKLEWEHEVGFLVAKPILLN